MPTVNDLYADHAYDNDPGPDSYGGILWSTQRSMGAGAVKVRPTDYTFTYKDPYNWQTITFDWLSMEFALYARRTGNRVHNPPLKIGGTTIRRNWGQNLGFTTIATPSSSGLYSLYTRPVQVRRNGSTQSFGPTTTGGMDWALRAKFDLQYS